MSDEQEKEKQKDSTILSGPDSLQKILNEEKKKEEKPISAATNSAESEPKPIQVMKLRDVITKQRKELADNEKKLSDLEKETEAKVKVEVPNAGEYRGENIKKLMETKEVEKDVQ